MKLSRNMLIAVALIIVAVVITYVVRQEELNAVNDQVAKLDTQVETLEKDVIRLSYNTASGGGINLKMMPDPETGEATVPLSEVFSFDRNHALCRVETNEHAFVMATHEMGEIVIEPHQFFMSMVVTSIEQFDIDIDSDGNRHVTMRGGIDCATEVGQTSTTIGSRDATEHATYRIEALDMGIGGGETGDTFAFTVFFNPEESPVNYAIFGPEFTFTGEMIAGEITITDPAR